MVLERILKFIFSEDEMPSPRHEVPMADTTSRSRPFVLIHLVMASETFSTQCSADGHYQLISVDV